MGLVGGSKSLGTGISRGLVELELKACLPVELKQLLEADVEVVVEVVILLQVIQTGVDRAQRGVNGSIVCLPKAVILAFCTHLHHHAQVPLGRNIAGSGHLKGHVIREHNYSRTKSWCPHFGFKKTV